MIVVSDTTAISNLFLIGRLELLREVFGNVLIPGAVYRELLQLSEQGYPIAETLLTDWIEVGKLKIPPVRRFVPSWMRVRPRPFCSPNPFAPIG